MAKYKHLTHDDLLEIQDLIANYGHIIDARQFSRIGELFTPDVVYDVSDMEAGVHHGLAAIRALWENTDRHPLAHLATNTVITEAGDGTVSVMSKGIMHGPDGKVWSNTYYDTVVRQQEGWRISKRTAIRRRPDRIPPVS